MIRQSSLLKVCAVVASIVTFAVCPAGAQAPQKGGTLKVVSTGGDVRCLGFGPEMRLFYQMLYSKPVCETLLKWDEKGQPGPGLAESFRIANDQKSITFHLRKGIKFHDGTDFDAEAVKYNAEAYQKSGRPELNAVSSFDVLDKDTIRFNLKNFDNMILTQLTLNVGSIISPAAHKNAGVDELCRAPVGTGPFRFKSWQRDLSIKFDRFDSYWQKGKPYLDSFEWVHIKDPMTAVSSFIAGEADAIIGVPYAQANELKKSGKYVIKTTPNAHISFVSDSANPNSPFSKLKVRQAVSHAIDSKAISDSILQEFGIVTNQFSIPGGWGYSSKVVGYPYDPSKAKRLLADAGYPNGFKTSIWIINADIRPQVAIAIQAYLKEIGIEAEVKPLEMSAWMDKMRSGWDGMMYTGSGVVIPDDVRGANVFSNPSATLYKSLEQVKELEDLVLKAMAAPDMKTKLALYQEWSHLITDKYCLANWVVVFPTICAIKKNIHDTGFLDVTFIQFRPEDTYITR